MPNEPLLASRAQKAFIFTITLQAIIVLVVIAYTFEQVSEHVSFHGEYLTLPCYLALFALAEVFELCMAFDALRMRNIIQLLGILLFHMALIVFSGIQIHQTHTALVKRADCSGDVDYVTCGGPGTLWRKIQPFLIVAPCVTGAAWLIMIIWIRQLYQDFGWAIFRVVGADRSMKTMYQWYQIMICLLKFDFFCFIGVTMQLLIVVLQNNSAEFGITVAAIPTVLLLLVACGIAVQREIKWLMTFSLVLMPAALSYFYKLVRFYEPSSRNQYATTRATLTVFTIVAFLLLFATFAVGLRCFADFDRGLQPSKVYGQSYTLVVNKMVPLKDSRARPAYSSRHSSGKSGRPADMTQRQSSYTAGTAMGPRISIE